MLSPPAPRITFSIWKRKARVSILPVRGGEGSGGALEPEERCWAQDGQMDDEQMERGNAEEEADEAEVEGVEKEARVDLPEP